jgi:N-acetylglucosamine kinase-like BadF-type ATPase
LLGLRAAVRAFEGRSARPTGLVDAVCRYFEINADNLRSELVKQAYQKPLGRAEIAGFTAMMTLLAGEDNAAAGGIVAKVVGDLS